MKSEANEHYPLPVFLKVSGKKCLIAGGGTVALRKAVDLMEAGALVTVIADKPNSEIERLNEQGKVELKRRRFEPDDIEGAFLVFAATGESRTNSEISAAAKQRGILVNVVDSPELCNFFSGAVVKRGPLQVAISTGGCCPSVAAGLRSELEKLYPVVYGEFIRSAGEWRRYILSLDNITDDTKQAAIKWLAQKDTFALFSEYGKEKTWEELKKILFSS